VGSPGAYKSCHIRSPAMYGLDESSNEAELLLSKFMSQSRQADEPSRGEGVQNGRLTSHSTPRRMASGNMKAARDSRSELIHKNRIGFPVLLPGTRASVISPKNSGGISPLPSNIQRPSRAGTASGRRDKSLSSLPDSPSVDTDTVRIVIPTLPSAKSVSSSAELSPTRVPARQPSEPNNPKRASRVPASRPRRSNTGPVNYYAKSAYSGYTSETEEEVHRVRLPVKVGVGVLSQGRPSLPQRSTERCRVIYSSQQFQICRRPFQSLDEIPDLPPYAPYDPENEPSRYVERFDSNPTRRVLHVSFDQEEMTAVLGLLAYHGFRSHYSEIALSEQIIQAARAISEPEFERSFAKRVTDMVKLNGLLVKTGFDNFETYRNTPAKPRSIESETWKRLGRLSNSLFQFAEEEPVKCLATASVLGRRTTSNIRSFLLDAREGNLPTIPYFIECRSLHSDLMTCENIGQARHGISTIFRDRERGAGPSKRYYQRLSDDGLRMARTWKGASNDVLNLTWSPDGTRFAVGAAAQCDEHNMQYNRPNNLLLGDLVHNTIKELPDHRISRPSASSTSDPHLYMSVTAVQWFEDKLYTASYDSTVKVWDVSANSGAVCIHTLRHPAKVQVMARADCNVNLLATGTESALGLWSIYGNNQTYQPLDLARSRLSKNVDLMPSSLAWGSTSQTKDILVAGMSGKEMEDGNPCKDGYLAMWKLNESSADPIQLSPNTQNVFDVKWHPTLPCFATGSSISALRTSGTARDARSTVRIYEPLITRSRIVELDCPALDINDVTFCPMSTTYVSASCTDGITYVWDFRNPAEILHKLPHGPPLNQLDELLTREQADVGVRVALWGSTMDRLYTGGSDGVLKSWNILLSPEDVHVQDVANLEDEIMCGVFSPDKTSLLVGDAAGGIHLFSSGSFSDARSHHMDFEPATEPKERDQGFKRELDPDSGIMAAQQFLSSGQLVRHPAYGVGKGPSYKGPYAAWARPEGTPSDKLPITPLINDIQATQLDGPPVELRTELDDAARIALDAQIQLSRIRNQRRNERKRKRKRRRSKAPMIMPEANIINLCSDEDDDSTPQNRACFLSVPAGIEVIDLTGDVDAEDGTKPQLVSHLFPSNDDPRQELLEDDDGLEEDYWWPESSHIDPNIHDSDI
jgi:WD40 repeat protein